MLSEQPYIQTIAYTNTTRAYIWTAWYCATSVIFRVWYDATKPTRPINFIHHVFALKVCGTYHLHSYVWILFLLCIQIYNMDTQTVFRFQYARIYIYKKIMFVLGFSATLNSLFAFCTDSLQTESFVLFLYPTCASIRMILYR